MIEHAAEDDKSIASDWVLWRRINPKWLTEDQNPERHPLRPNSQNFKPSKNRTPVSLYISHECGDPNRLLYPPYEDQFVASVTARQVRDLQLGLKRVDRDEDLKLDGFVIEGHVEVTGNQKRAEKLAARCLWVKGPPNLSAPAW